MIVDNVKCKLVSLNSYNKKDEKGNRLEEKGYMFTIATDFRDKSKLKNKVLSPMCSKDFVLDVPEEDFTFGADILCTLDIPLVDPGDKSVFPAVLYSVSLVNQTVNDSEIPFK